MTAIKTIHEVLALDLSFSRIRIRSPAIRVRKRIASPKSLQGNWIDTRALPKKRFFSRKSQGKILDAMKRRMTDAMKEITILFLASLKIIAKTAPRRASKRMSPGVSLIWVPSPVPLPKNADVKEK